MRDWSRFDAFLDDLQGDVYPEPPSEPAVSITRSAIENLWNDGLIRPGDRVLDVGCGQGGALEHFRKLGLHATGVTLGADLQVCRDKGLDVREMDQNFMDFPDEQFHLLWCRHVLEHSVAPLFTLSEYRRILRRGGLAYVEVPAPDTSAHHEQNENHYSVLTRSAWVSLFARAEFKIERQLEIRFTVPCGPDLYWAFLLHRTRRLM